MKSQLRDPELDRLVEELTQGGADPAGPSPAERLWSRAGWRDEASGLSLDRPSQSLVVEGEPLDRLLAEMIRREASDLLLVPGLPPVVRIHSRLVQLDELPAVDGEELFRTFQDHLGARARRELEEGGSTDFSLRLAGAARSEGRNRSFRFRVNLHRQRGELAGAVRALPSEIPSLAGLNLPPVLAELIKPSRGLVLVCGPTGSGKSSTLAAMVAEINRTRTSHVLTIEDPIEYEHASLRSLVEHVEVGRDTRSFHEALRAAMRQDPDVILGGEMRDLETVATALTAAETGHLVLSTLHTNDAQQAVHRIVDVFPPAQQAQIRHQLALSLHAVVVQQLVPRADGRGRVPAVELLLATYAVRNHIRGDHLQKLYNEIVLGKRLGMISLEASLAQLVQRGLIDVEEARVRASHPDELELLLRG